MWSEIAHGIIIKRNAQSKSRTGQRNPQSVRPIYPRRFQGQKQDEPRNQCRRIHDEIECILPRSRTIILLYLQREIYEAVAQTGQKRIYQPILDLFPSASFLRNRILENTMTNTRSTIPISCVTLAFSPKKAEAKQIGIKKERLIMITETL